MPYIVPTNEKPTYWNRDTALGTLIGNFCLPLIGAPFGAAIGGYFGKERMERELKEGKVVKEPSFWNKKAFIGLFLGAVIAGVIFSPLLFIHTTVAAVCFGAAVLTGHVIGLMKGGESGKAEMAQEYRTAQQSQGMGVSPLRTREPAVEFNNPITRDRPFTQDVAASRNTPTPGMTH